jgi:hypothetical protein
MNQYRETLLLLTSVLCFVAGCSGVPTGAPTNGAEPQNSTLSGSESGMNKTNTTATGQNPGISSPVNEVIRATNRSSAAAENDIEFRDGAVMVVIELRSGANRSVLPENSVEITADAGKRVQGWVAVERLGSLSRIDGVNFIRAPRTPRQSSLQQ